MILDRGQSVGIFPRHGLEPERLLQLMGGGEELDKLTDELAALRGVADVEPPDELAESIYR